MELRDRLFAFWPAGAPAILDLAEVQPRTRIAFLTERPKLERSMQRALDPSATILTQVFSVELIERAINSNLIDVAIVDIDRQDEWPDSVFSRFDTLAAHFPIIILCRTRRHILTYLRKAKHLVFILSYETIDDPRFLGVILTAQLCAEVTRDNGSGDESNDGGRWVL